MGIADNYVCEGQMDIFDFLTETVSQKSKYKKSVSQEVKKKSQERAKPVIFHMGLSAYYYECPYCRATNSVEHSEEGIYCRCCLKFFDGEIERKTKDLTECEKQLGTGGGAVYKDEKGKWHYSEIK